MKSERELLTKTLPFIKENRLLSWFYTISSFMLLACCLFLTLLEINLGFRIVASVFSGLLIVRLFVIYHDFLHHAILKKSKVAKIIFSLFGYYILAPKTIWDRSHNYHHANNSKLFKSSFGSFPVYTKSRFERLSKKEQRNYLFTRHPLVIVFGYYFTFLLGMCVLPLFKNFSKNFEGLIAIFFHFALQISILSFFGLESLILFSIMPHFISGAIGTYLFYVQHNFPGVVYYVDKNWTYEKAALESSSYLKVGKFAHWFTANIGYHHVHHVNPRVPFYKLPEIMRKIEEFKHPKTTSFKISAIISCFRLKLWDSEKNKMVGLNE